MAQFILPNPYDAGYALPDHVMAEPPGRGAFVSKGPIRGTIQPTADFQKEWNPGYQLPGYVAMEAWGQNPFTTKGPTRGTIQQLVPFPMSGVMLPDAPRAQKMRAVGGCYETLSGADPITDYGYEAANLVASSVAKLPKSQRASALKSILNKVDPSLIKRTALKAAIVGPEAALAAAMTEGMLAELAAIGSGKKPRKNGPLSGLGACCDACAKGKKTCGGKPALGGVFDDIGGAIGSVTSGLGNLACKMLGNPLTAGAAAVGGGVAAATGVAMAGRTCGSGAAAQPVIIYQPPTDYTPFLLLGGAAVLAIMLVK